MGHVVTMSSSRKPGTKFARFEYFLHLFTHTIGFATHWLHF
ncbi:hypothetical protein HanRHA438_Chr05g0219421 [Helianthus annuus]|nr:hypothetical protein HanRHA438_Chr05g0219421 [Helianthus annuus]